ncbi:MAG: helix-turn-helix domain-containing protein [Neisseria sp.]|nr:helix-turn-helix domain-containing protein [Neisseria sp.]
MNSPYHPVSIAQCVTVHLDNYLRDLENTDPCGIYEMVLQQVEKPLLKTVLDYCDGNQTRAAAMLGINRSTLRKKIALYDL